jgi:hypothetical protein
MIELNPEESTSPVCLNGKTTFSQVLDIEICLELCLEVHRNYLGLP